MIAYLDNFLIIGKTKKETEEAFQKTKALMESLEFVINEDKSQSKATHGDRVPWVHNRFKGHEVQDIL